MKLPKTRVGRTAFLNEKRADFVGVATLGVIFLPHFTLDGLFFAENADHAAPEFRMIIQIQ